MQTSRQKAKPSQKKRIEENFTLILTPQILYRHPTRERHFTRLRRTVFKLLVPQMRINCSESASKTAQRYLLFRIMSERPRPVFVVRHKALPIIAPCRQLVQAHHPLTGLSLRSRTSTPFSSCAFLSGALHSTSPAHSLSTQHNAFDSAVVDSIRSVTSFVEMKKGTSPVSRRRPRRVETATLRQTLLTACCTSSRQSLW